jgi:hypothetical protein
MHKSDVLARIFDLDFSQIYICKNQQVIGPVGIACRVPLYLGGRGGGGCVV